MSISRNIKELRELHGLTQVEFGKIAGVSDKAVSTWENGTAEPRMGAIQRIADYFHISKGAIIDDASEEENELKRICKDICGGNGSDDEMCELVTLYFGEEVSDTVKKFMLLDDDDKKDIIDLMASKLSRDKYSNGTA